MTVESAIEAQFSQLRVWYGTGRSYVVSGTGRDRVYGYRSGVMTELGDLELYDWTEKIERLISKTGEDQLQSQLLQWLKEHNHTKASVKELKHEALKLHAARIFDDPMWCDFVAWNQRYCPEKLAEVELVWVVTDCCQKPGQTTRAQIEKAYQSQLSCPHCGRFSEFRVCKNEKGKE